MPACCYPAKRWSINSQKQTSPNFQRPGFLSSEYMKWVHVIATPAYLWVGMGVVVGLGDGDKRPQVMTLIRGQS